jgi:uncharacterized protein DUF6010
MARLRKFEPVAFLLVFLALGYAFAVLPPRSALYDLFAPETHAAWASVVVALALLLLRLLPRRRLRLERFIYAIFLAGMPFIYLAAALKLGSGSGMAMELVGVPVFTGLAAYGYYKSFPVLGLGIAAHGLGWDLWHHGSVTYIAGWYPLACLVIDLALGFLAMTQAGVHQAVDSRR